MCSDIAIQIKELKKTYRLYDKPIHKLWEVIGIKKNGRIFNALNNISFEVNRGQVIGVVGRNGAGKSTLLQIICGTLQPTSGSVFVNGRIAALLELGAGFNPDFTGRENVFLNASVLGLTKKEIEERFDEIVTFSELENFIDQPVKTYSSGMLIRLAFSVATSVDPDILIIDEALSVGDGMFARKSFDRIMNLKEKGATILFCSHNLYQVQVLCEKAIWLTNGEITLFGSASIVTYEYQKALDDDLSKSEKQQSFFVKNKSIGTIPYIKSISVQIDKIEGVDLHVVSEKSNLEIITHFHYPELLPKPTIGIVITDDTGKNITSCTNLLDQHQIKDFPKGQAKVKVLFPNIPLLQGKYLIHVFLMCEKSLHIYAHAQCATIKVEQENNQLGIVSIPRIWSQME